MAQENANANDHIAPPPAISSDSMDPGKDSNGDGSNTGSPVAAVGAVDKGKGVVKIEIGEEGGSNKGKRAADGDVDADVAAADGPAAKVARAQGRRGDRDVHIVTERERRKRMSEMFNKLHSLLPGLPDKIDKSSIVMEAIQYIKGLEVTLSELEKRKLETMELGRRYNAANGGGSSSMTASAAAPQAQAQPPPVLRAAAGGIFPMAMATPVLPVPQAGGGGVNVPIGLQTWSASNVVLSLSGDDAYINVCVARRQGVLTMVASVLEKHSIDMVTSGVSSDGSRSMFTIHARVNGPSTRFGHNLPSEEIYKLAVSEIMVWLSD